MSSGGQVFGGIVGAVAGYFLPGANVFLGAQIGLTLGGLIDPPKGPVVNGPRLDDLSVQTSTYGAVIPRVYGTVTVNGNVFWLENNRLKETVTKKKSGGKGGGSKTTTRTYTYSATFAVGLCKGPIVGVRRIWIGPDLIYDAGSSDPATITASNAAADGFALYLGTDTQSPDARMQATLGVPNTPAWRGLAYIVFYDLALARYANSLAGAQVKVELFTVGTTGVPIVQLSNTPYIGGQYQLKPGFASWGGVAISQFPFGTNQCLTTTDGLNWVAGTLPVTSSWNAVYGYGSRICAVSHAPYYALMTSNGTVWTSVSVPSRDYGPITHNGSVWCISANGYASISGDNGASWNETALPSSTGSQTCCISHNGRIIISAGGYQAYFTSDDNGTTFTQRAFPFGAGLGIKVAASNGSIIVGVVEDTANCSISTDGGTTWGTPSLIISGQTFWQSMCYGSGVFFVSKGFRFATSSDGVTWTLTNIPSAYSTGYDLNTTAYTGYGFSSVATNFGTVCSLVTIGITSANDALSNIVSTECLQSGLLTGGDVDVSALTSSVRGYRIGSIGAIRAALEPLQAAWPFDVVQHGYVVRFVARGGTSVVTISAADLDARGAGQEPGVQITTSREMDSQLPRRVTVQHLDYDREYNTGTQYAERLNTAAINASVLDLPIVLTATEAAGKAEVLLYLYWLERYDVSVTLPPTYNQLEPGDVVTLVTPEGNVSLRLTAVHYTSDGRLECQAKYANAAIYTPTAVGSSPAWTGPTTITPVGASVYVLLDVPMINSAQSGPSFLAAMTGALAGWRGGVLMQSTDAGSTWASLQDFGPPGASLGTCTNSIGAVEPRVIDNASLLNVTLTQGALYSVTQLAMLGGANHFAYGADGRWEIIAAQTCTLVSGTSYVLQNLLRGRFGSEWAMGLHAVGDSLILLDTTDVAAIAMSAGTIGLSYLYRGITVDRDISTDSNRAFAYQGVNLKPLSPIALTGNRDAGNDWTLTWIRRTRDGGEWRDYVDASLGEAAESYAIDVYADGSYAAVKRTITAIAPSCVYSSADQVSDFGTNQATLYLKIYQVSATVGRGYPLTSSINSAAMGYSASVTVPSTSVSANLTGFPLFIDLALMSSAWWESLYYRDGRDIRVSISGADIPFDLVTVDPVNRTGHLFAKTDLSSTTGTTVTVSAGQPANGFVAPTDPNGRNAVWTNYHRVFTFGADHTDRTGNGYPTAYAPTVSMQVSATGPNTYSHQGVAWDGTSYYVSGTNKLTKYDAAWNILATNNNPLGSIGGGTNHIGDIEVVDGVVYAPAENYSSVSSFSGMRIARFRADTLAYIDSVSISAQGHEASSIAYCKKDGYLYVSSYADGSKLWRYDRSTLAYVGSINLSSTIALIQGVTWWREAFWINSDSTKSTFRVEYSGSVRGSVYSISGTYDQLEGIGHTDNSLILLVDASSGPNNGIVRTLTDKTLGKVQAVEFSTTSDQFEFLTGLTRYTAWTMGCSVRLDSKSATQGILTYTVNGSSANADRVTLAYRLSSDRIGLWNDTDTWLLDTISPVVGTTYRFNISHNGTSGRKIYRDGTLTASAGSCTARPSASADAIVMGIESWARAEDMTGALGFVYLAPTVFSDPYVAAESANLTSPSTFYTITG